MGAAVACPDRKVLCMQADGSAMYTVQALWTMAREKLDVVTVIFSNRKYAILQVEFMRVGAHNPGPKAMSMLDLSNPDIDWVAMAKAMGVEAERVDEATAFHTALARAIAASSAFSIAGGGDTLAAIDQFAIADQLGYISTGGGAFLEFVEGKTLPAVAALSARADA